MPCIFSRSHLVALVFATSLTSSMCGQAAQTSVSESELMALVAGNALSENIAREIGTRGLAFHPDEIYKTQLKNAGADKLLLAAMDKAKIAAGHHQEDGPTELGLTAHLSNAGRLLRNGQFDAATAELTAALQQGADTEAGFVMGEVLRRQEQFDFTVRVYQKVLQQSPAFPEVHTKLAYILYRLEDYDGAIREAGLALARTPENAEAHKNMGLPLAGKKQFEAAIQEYQAALRIKPDYGVVHFDLALLLNARHDSAGAILEYRKAIALDPNQADWHYNLAIQLKDTGDTEGAIREYREAKRCDPKRIDVRQNLALALVELDPDASIREFHELLAIAPDFQLGHKGLGVALSRKGDLQGSETEYRKAIALDPTDAEAHSNLGSNLAKQKKYDEALAEYARAAELDPNAGNPHYGMGMIYLQRNDYAGAIRELRPAVQLDPSGWESHASLAKALSATGDVKGAILELKQAKALNPQNDYLIGELAALLDKDGDLVGSLKLYRQMADMERTDEARKQYAAAQQRAKEKIGSLRAAGKQAEAADLEAAVDEKVLDLESQWRDGVEQCHRAMSDRRYQDAEKSCQAVLAIAEKLRPVDQHLLQSILDVARTYTLENKYPEALAEWQHGLKVAQQNFGPESKESIFGFEGLAGVAYLQKNYASSASYYARAAELNEKLFDGTDPRVLNDLFWLGSAYEGQGAFDKAEPVLLRVLQINENGTKAGTPLLEANLLQLGRLYLAWGKYEKAEPYCRKSLAMREQWFGQDSPVLADPLETLANVLTNLGKQDEAAQLRKRREDVLAAAGKPEAKK